jgi:drug/metabolite transporter (DMT)-like permease
MNTLINRYSIEYEDDGGNQQQAYTKEFWIGIGVSVVTNLVQSFAMAFQRKSHLINDSIYPIEDRKNSLKRPLWVISFATFLTANIIGSVFSIGYLPIVILAPIGAMGLVFNAIAAKIVLGDPFKKKTVIGKIDCIVI